MVVVGFFGFLCFLIFFMLFKVVFFFCDFLKLFFGMLLKICFFLIFEVIGMLGIWCFEVMYVGLSLSKFFLGVVVGLSLFSKLINLWDFNVFEVVEGWIFFCIFIGGILNVISLNCFVVCLREN